LPDGIFPNQECLFGYILEWVGVENVVTFFAIWNILQPFGIICNQLECFMAIWYILWSFGNFSPHFGMLYLEKSGNPDLRNAIFFIG
jgi:hypothetical protein